MRNSNYSSGYGNANKNLQMEEWAYKGYFAAAIINESTDEPMEYRDLIKKPDLRELWHPTSLSPYATKNGVFDIIRNPYCYILAPARHIPSDLGKLKATKHGRFETLRESAHLSWWK